MCEQLTLLIALYIHDTVVRNGEPQRYSIIEKRMVISDTWSRNIATKNIPPLVKDQSSDQFPSQQQQRNVDRRKKEKGLGRWVLSGSRRINVQMGNFVWCQTDNHVRIVAVTQECSAADVVASGSWMRKDDGE